MIAQPGLPALVNTFQTAINVTNIGNIITNIIPPKRAIIPPAAAVSPIFNPP
jgi:hypothetical protein